MRALYSFVAGFASSGALWIYLDRIAPTTPGSRGEPIVAPPRAEPVRPSRPPDAAPSRAATTLAQPARAATPRSRVPRAPEVPPLQAAAAPAPRRLAAATGPADRTPFEERPEVRRARRPHAPVAVAVGVGTEAAIGADLAGNAGLASLRVVLDPDRDLGLELGLVSAVIGTYGSTSLEGLVRWHLSTGSHLRPYAAAGVGWRRFHEPWQRDLLTIPVGVGLVYRRGDWYADARVQLRPTPTGAAHTVSASGFIGRAF